MKAIIKHLLSDKSVPIPRGRSGIGDLVILPANVCIRTYSEQLGEKLIEECKKNNKVTIVAPSSIGKSESTISELMKNLKQMNGQALKQRINEIPDGVVITKVHIEMVNKYKEPSSLEYEKSEDEIREIKQKRFIFNFNNLKFW